MKKKKPTALIILDGFGHSKNTQYNAIAQASTPCLDKLFSYYPHTTLRASGTAVGLPKNYIGNSEVGHLTIGSGRINIQPLTMINNTIDNNTLDKNSVLITQLKKITLKNTTLHIIGLLSDAGVHSHEKHLYAYLKIAIQLGIKKIAIHPFLDGRDVSPKTAATYLTRLESKLKILGIGTIGSLHGRFYAMDRDNNWERTKKSFAALTQLQTTQIQTWQEILKNKYKNNITDEFIPPTQLDPKSIVRDGDGIIFINFRPDRARQLTSCFIEPNFNTFKKKFINLSFFITPISYNKHLKTDVLFELPPIKSTLKETLAANNKTIFSIAETEKYAHVSYFFSGGREKAFSGETQVLVPSIAARNYINHPEMSAQKITNTAIESLKTNPCDFYLINYANADMVGHSGNIQATIKSIECLDAQISLLYNQIIEVMNGTIYITADHGNAENMFDTTSKQPRTAHTSNPVPFIFIKKKLTNLSMKLKLYQLADIAPFILKNMELPIPKEMEK